MRGEKEKELALAEGKYPVIDVSIDVFAIISSPGRYVTCTTGMTFGSSCY